MNKKCCTDTFQQQLMDFGKKIIPEQDAIMSCYIDDPGWLADNLYRFQQYEPGLFEEQFKALLVDSIGGEIKPELETIYLRCWINLESQINRNTQVRQIKYKYSGVQWCVYKDYVDLNTTTEHKISVSLLLDNLPRNRRLNCGYCEENNILFVQVQEPEFQRNVTCEDIFEGFNADYSFGDE